MNKKAKTYLLIVIIILSWGYVGYKIYTAIQGDDELELSLERPQIKKIADTNKEDSIVLLLNYPDPFLKDGNFSKEQKKINRGYSQGSPNAQKQIAPKSQVVVPATDIKYVGLVKNNDKGTSTAMIMLNGKSSFVKLKDVIDGFTIQEISKNYIKLKKGKEIVVVKK